MYCSKKNKCENCHHYWKLTIRDADGRVIEKINQCALVAIHEKGATIHATLIQLISILDAGDKNIAEGLAHNLIAMKKQGLLI